jgi:hypothetical protein
MNDRKKLLMFLGLEVAVLCVVISSFKLIAEKFVAGMIGGVLFVSLGLFVCLQCIRSKRLKVSATMVMGLIHLFVTSLPMFLTRLLNSSGDFSEVKILGIPGPAFHGVSSSVYLLFMIATVFDLIRIWRADRSAIAH